MTDNTDDLRLQEWQAEAEMSGLEEVEIPGSPLDSSDAVPIPIPSQARQVAEQFAAEQATPEKAEQVRRNTLAAIALRDYLQFQGYIADLAASDCWNPILRRLDNVADLEVAGVGRLECRAFRPGQEFCSLPENVQYGRVGYVAIELASEDCWAWLLGFVPLSDSEFPLLGLRRAELQSMDALGEHLRRLWLFRQIVPEVLQEEGAEPWDSELREEIIALLERIYRTHNSAERPELAAQKIEEIKGLELEATAPIEREAIGNRDQSDAGEGNKLRHILREVFDRVTDELEEA